MMKQKIMRITIVAALLLMAGSINAATTLTHELGSNVTVKWYDSEEKSTEITEVTLTGTALKVYVDIQPAENYWTDITLLTGVEKIASLGGADSRKTTRGVPMAGMGTIGKLTTQTYAANGAGLYEVVVPALADGQRAEQIIKINLKGTVKACTDLATATITATSAVYTGEALKATSISAALGETALTENVDYTVTTNDSGTNTGTYAVGITGMGRYKGTATNLTAFEITKAAGSIGYATASIEKTYGDDAFTNTLTKVGDGAVTYSVDPAGVVTVDENTGEVTIVASGTTTITATVADGTNYAYATKTAQYAIGVDKAMIAVTAEGYNAVYDGNNHGITVTVTSPEDATVMFRDDDENYTLTESPTYSNVGSYTVYYKVAKDNYTTINSSQPVVITAAAGSISYATGSVEKSYGDDVFTNELTKVGDGAVTYATYPAGVATIDADGQVTIVGTGTTTITATVTNGTNYTYATTTAEYTLTVKPMTVEVEDANGETVKTDINMDITDEEQKEVKITDISIPESETESTVVAIPATITIAGNEYSVTEIANDLFAGKTDVTDIYLPETEKPIVLGENALRISDTQVATVHAPLALLDDYSMDNGLQQTLEASKLLATVTPPFQYWTLSCGIDVKVPEGVKVFKCSLNSDGTGVVITQISDDVLGGIIKANNGVLIGSTAGNAYDIVASKNPEITTIAYGDVKSYGSDNLLEPVIQSKNYDAANYYVLFNNEFREILANDSKVPACKAVLRKPAGVSASRSLGISDGTTGIISIDNGQWTIDNWYNLQGRRVSGSAKGVVIKNGKKMVNK